jgi:cytosolic carboxypeptidase protein 5
MGCFYRAWYYFYVTGFAPGETVDFVIKNMSNQSKLYSFGMRPYFREVLSDGYTNSAWSMIPNPDVRFTKSITPVMSFPQHLPPNDRSVSNCYELHFTHRFSATHLPYNALSTRTYFAYSEPYTYTDLCSQLNEIERRLANHAQVYFCRELLTYTLEGRRVELLTITSYKDIGFEREAHIEKLFPLSNKTL